MVSWIVFLPFLSLSFSNCAMIIFSAIPSLINGIYLNGIYLSFSSHSVILLLWLLCPLKGLLVPVTQLKTFGDWIYLFIYFFLLVIPLPAWARWKPFVDSLSLFLSLSSSFRNWLMLSFLNTILELADIIFSFSSNSTKKQWYSLYGFFTWRDLFIEPCSSKF